MLTITPQNIELRLGFFRIPFYVLNLHFSCMFVGKCEYSHPLGINQVIKRNLSSDLYGCYCIFVYHADGCSSGWLRNKDSLSCSRENKYKKNIASCCFLNFRNLNKYYHSNVANSLSVNKSSYLVNTIKRLTVWNLSCSRTLSDSSTFCSQVTA